MNLNVIKLNESFSLIQGDSDDLKILYDYLKVERPGAYFETLVQRGIKSPYTYYSTLTKNGLMVYNGHLEVLEKFGVQPYNYKTEFTDDDIRKYAKEVKKILPFQPYDYQWKLFLDAVRTGRMLGRACTSAGKSLSLSLICDFFRTKGLRGILLVPNINLLSQFRNDIKSYNLIDLYENTEVQGDGHSATFEKPLVISTWQSMMNIKDKRDFDYVMCDECVARGTLIETKDGPKPIEKICVNDLIYSFNGDIIELKKVLDVYHNLPHENMYEIEFENNKTLKLTGNHPVWTQRGWVQAKDLTLDDEVLEISEKFYH